MKTISPLLLASALALAGCSTAPNWEAKFGEASRDARAAQTHDARATERNGDRGGSTDGKAAAGAQTKYGASMGYAVKEAAPTVVIQPTAK